MGAEAAAAAQAARGRLRGALALELGAVEHVVEGHACAAVEGALAHVPLIVKDVLDVGGVPTTAGSVGWVRRPLEDAASVGTLRRAGAVVVAKGHTNEWALGIDGRKSPSGALSSPGGP